MGTRRSRNHISYTAATLDADTVTNLAVATAFAQKLTVPAGHTWIELVPAANGDVTFQK